MTDNIAKPEVYHKGLKRLAHPFTLLALLLLFVNDWFLRIHWPGWWTGKIGDFAWLFFFPLLPAALISVLFPDQEKPAILSSLVFTGLVFSLANVSPAFNNLVTGTIQFVLHIPVQITRDPGDLIALLSLGGCWAFWQADLEFRPLKAGRGWVAFQLGLLLTVANMPAQDYGIHELAHHGEQLIARSGYRRYVSRDGGLTWEETDPVSDLEEKELPEAEEGVLYEYTPGEIIRLSRDAGKTFPYQYALTPASQPLKIKYEMRDGVPVFKKGPLEAGIDPVSEQVIFAMGHEGVLVFTSDQEWVWVSLGPYQRLKYEPSREFVSLLMGELLLSLGFGLLVINTLTLGIQRGWFRNIVAALGWLGLLSTGMLFPPALFLRQPPNYFLAPMVQNLIILLAVLVFLILDLLDLIKLYDREGKIAWTVLGIGLAGMVVFLTPYLLWAFMIIPNYSTAATLAFTVSGLLFGLYYLEFFKDAKESVAAERES